MERKGPRGWKDKPQTQKTILLKDTLDKGMLSGIHEELLELNTKKITWYNNGPKILTDTLPKKMTNKHIKKCPIPHVIREIYKLKWWDMLYTYEEGQNPRILTTLNSGKDIWNNKNSHLLLVGMQNSTATLKDRSAIS